MTDDDIFSAMNDVDNVDGSDGENSGSTVVSDSEQTDSNNYTVTLTKDSFIKFSNVLGIIQNICNDCDIRNGLLRCRTNDRRCLISIDISSVIGNRNISFSGLKNKLSLLSTFNFVADSSADSSILIEANDSNFEFSDSISKLTIRRPIASYLDNIYVDDDEFSTITGTTMRQDASLFNISISAMEKKRMAKLCDVFCSNTVTFEFFGDTCQYSTETSSKDNLSKTQQSITLLKEIKDKKTLVNNLAFILDTPSNLDISCYLEGNDCCLFKSDLNFYGIPVTIYTKSRIVDVNAD